MSDNPRYKPKKDLIGKTITDLNIDLMQAGYDWASVASEDYASTSVVPDRYFNLSESDTASFLRGVFDRSGGLNLMSKNKDVVPEDGVFIHEGAACSDIQVLLGKVGIISYFEDDGILRIPDSYIKTFERAIGFSDLMSAGIVRKTVRLLKKTTVLYIPGTYDYSAASFEENFTVNEIASELEVGEKKTFESEDYCFDAVLLEFGNIDPDFIKFLQETMNLRENDHTNFYIVEED